jgi:hypothetical protein
MPTIARLPNGVKIRMYYNDHGDAHFHVEKPGEPTVRLRIADLQPLSGTVALPQAHVGVVVPWASNHQAELALNWIMARAGMGMNHGLPYP